MSRSQNVFFGRRQLEYLGHIIFIEGMVADPSKVESMLSWPRPSTVSGPRGFLGLIGCYHRFVRNYGKICEPFNELLKEITSYGMKMLKMLSISSNKLWPHSSAPVLAMPDFSKEFVIECDEFGAGARSCSLQGGRPIAYASKALSHRNLGLSTNEKELLPVVFAISRWRLYLIGRHFKMKSDHLSLKQVLE